jgi:hypothetical protein
MTYNFGARRRYVPSPEAAPTVMRGDPRFVSGPFTIARETGNGDLVWLLGKSGKLLSRGADLDAIRRQAEGMGAGEWAPVAPAAGRRGQ